MKRLFAATLFLCLCVTTARGVAPTQIQHRGCPSGANSTTCGGLQCTYATYFCELPMPTLAGNIVIITGQYAFNAAVTVSFTDENADTFIIDKKNTVDTNQTQIIAHAFTTAGSRKVTVTFSGANATFTQWDAGEYNNISGLDSCSSNQSTTGANPNTVTAGSITPTLTGDLFIQIAVPESGVAISSYTVGSQANITWAFRQYDIGYGSGQVAQQAVQWGVYNSTAALNPTMTLGTINIAWGSTACAYKQNSSGTADPGGARIVTLHHYNVQSVTSTTVILGFPASGNTGYLGCITAPVSGPITAVSGSVTGVWNHIGDIPDHNGSGVLMLWDKVNTTLSVADILTLTTTTNLSVADCVVYGLENMAIAPLDTAVTAGTGTTCIAGLCSMTGDDTTSANISSVSLTPSASTSGFVIMQMGVNSPQTTGCTNPSDTAYSPQEGAQQEMDENNTKCNQPYSSASPITFVVTKGQGAATSGVHGWAASAVAFKAAATVAQFPQMLIIRP